MSVFNWIGWGALLLGLVVSMFLDGPATTRDVYTAAMLLFLAQDKA